MEKKGSVKQHRIQSGSLSRRIFLPGLAHIVVQKSISQIYVCTFLQPCFTKLFPFRLTLPWHQRSHPLTDYSRAQKFRTTCLKFEFLQQSRKSVSFVSSHYFLCWKNIVALLMMILQPSRMSSLTVWLPWKQKIIKVIASFSAKNTHKKGGYQL